MFLKRAELELRVLHRPRHWLEDGCGMQNQPPALLQARLASVMTFMQAKKKLHADTEIELNLSPKPEKSVIYFQITHLLFLLTKTTKLSGHVFDQACLVLIFTDCQLFYTDLLLR